MRPDIVAGFRFDVAGLVPGFSLCLRARARACVSGVLMLLLQKGWPGLSKTGLHSRISIHFASKKA